MSFRNITTISADNTALQLADYFPDYQKGIIYLLWKKLEEGHVCIHWNEVNKKNPEWHEEFEPVSREEFQKRKNEIQPIISHEDLLYLNRYFKYETSLIENIKKLILSPGKEYDQPGKVGGDMQENAVQACLQKNFVIISGGPGTGKTTTVAKILTRLFSENPDLKVALAAPTGKAAARMGESLKNAGKDLSPDLKKHIEDLIPTTIHRLLGVIRDSLYFVHDHQNPLPLDVVIIDESSMIDLALFSKLLSAIGTGTKLILLGDRHQLTSVEAGSVFSDLCSLSEEFKNLTESKKKNDDSQNSETGEGNIIELKKSYRFSSDKGIGKLSGIILEQKTAELGIFLSKDDEQVTLDSQYDEKIFRDFILGYGDYIKEEKIEAAFKKLNQLRVLCAVKEGGQSVYQTNARIEKILEEKNLIRRTGIFYQNRPIMITQNNYSLQLFNGDTGIVRRDEDGKLKVWFEQKGTFVNHPVAFINGEETAFAITIHKSQGSEFNKVLTILPVQDNQILSNELIYTAVTRAREKVIIQSSKEVLNQALLRNVHRGSGIKQRFSEP